MRQMRKLGALLVVMFAVLVLGSAYAPAQAAIIETISCPHYAITIPTTNQVTPTVWTISNRCGTTMTITGDYSGLKTIIQVTTKHEASFSDARAKQDLAAKFKTSWLYPASKLALSDATVNEVHYLTASASMTDEKTDPWGLLEMEGNAHQTTYLITSLVQQFTEGNITHYETSVLFGVLCSLRTR